MSNLLTTYLQKRWLFLSKFRRNVTGDVTWDILRDVAYQPSFSVTSDGGSVIPNSLTPIVIRSAATPRLIRNGILSIGVTLKPIIKETNINKYNLSIGRLAVAPSGIPNNIMPAPYELAKSANLSYDLDNINIKVIGFRDGLKQETGSSNVAWWSLRQILFDSDVDPFTYSKYTTGIPATDVYLNGRIDISMDGKELDGVMIVAQPNTGSLLNFAFSSGVWTGFLNWVIEWDITLVCEGPSRVNSSDNPADDMVCGLPVRFYPGASVPPLVNPTWTELHTSSLFPCVYREVVTHPNPFVTIYYGKDIIIPPISKTDNLVEDAYIRGLDRLPKAFTYVSQDWWQHLDDFLLSTFNPLI